MKLFRNKNLLIILCLIGLSLSYLLTEIYLTNFFKFDGESYRKGLGHILNEDNLKGVLFLFFRNFFVFFFFASLVFISLGKYQLTVYKSFFKPFAIIILIILFAYTTKKIFDFQNKTYDNIYRIIELNLVWITRFLSVIFSNFLILKYNKLVSNY